MSKSNKKVKEILKKFIDICIENKDARVRYTKEYQDF